MGERELTHPKEEILLCQGVVADPRLKLAQIPCGQRRPAIAAFHLDIAIHIDAIPVAVPGVGISHPGCFVLASSLEDELTLGLSPVAFITTAVYRPPPASVMVMTKSSLVAPQQPARLPPVLLPAGEKIWQSGKVGV